MNMIKSHLNVKSDKKASELVFSRLVGHGVLDNYVAKSANIWLLETSSLRY